MFHTVSVPRACSRLLLGAGAVVLATVALPGAAQAHIEVQPGTTEGGDFSVVAFRVPNERDNASTTKLSVILPADVPIGSVQTTPVPGWSVRTATRHLSEPIDLFGEKLDTVVSRVTWTATAGGVAPGQFQDFDLSLGPLPASGQLRFRALQTYSSGEQVNWNEVSTDPSVEPEHPAPTLTITPPPAEGATTGSSAGSSAGSAAETGLPTVLSGAALVLSALAVLVARRRGRTDSVDVSTPKERTQAGAGV